MVNRCQGAVLLIGLRKNATTMPVARLALQQAGGTDRELTQQYGISVDTVRKWRHRTSGHDVSSTPYRLPTTLSGAQEELVIALCAANHFCRSMTCWRWCGCSSSRR